MARDSLKGVLIEARPEGAYWTVEVKQKHGDTYFVRRFAVLDADLITLDTLSALAETGETSADDRWCDVCAGRVIHKWAVTDGVLRAICLRGHETPRLGRRH